MNYCVLIHLSRTTISFWYQQQGAPVEPLAKKEGNVVPLYFYVNCNDFILGTFAKERFLNGDTTSTFGDYFKIVADPSKYFKIFGNKKHVKFLLYYAIEQYLSHFLNTVLYKNESIEEYRNSFPLRFMFSSDIARKERLLVENIFSESGYDNVETLSYYEFLYSTLNKQGLIVPNLSIIFLTGIDGNMIVELFNEATMSLVDEEIVEEQGADPRIKIMAKMLYENAISTIHFALNEKTETAHLLPFAKDFLYQESAIPRGDITLSDGTVCYVQIRKKELNERLLYYSGEDKIFKAIDNLLKKNNIPDNLVQFVLNGDAVNTPYFIERLKKKFSQVIGTPPNTQNEVLKMAFRSIADANYLPTTIPLKVKQPLKTEDNEIHSLSGSTPLLPPIPPPWPNSSQKIGQINPLTNPIIETKVVTPPALIPPRPVVKVPPPPPPRQVVKASPPPPPLPPSRQVVKAPPLPPPAPPPPPRQVVKVPPPPPPKPIEKTIPDTIVSKPDMKERK